MSANIYGYSRDHRWLLVHIADEVVTSTNDDEAVEAILDDPEQTDYLIIDRAEGIYTDTGGMDENISEHEFEKAEDDGEEEESDDD